MLSPAAGGRCAAAGRRWPAWSQRVLQNFKIAVRNCPFHGTHSSSISSSGEDQPREAKGDGLL